MKEIYLSKKINFANGSYLIAGLATFFIGLLLSLPASELIKVAFMLIVFLFVCFIFDPLTAITLLLFVRPSIDPFTKLQFTGNINLLGVFSILYIIFLAFFSLSNRKFDAMPSEIRFYYIFLFISLLSVINSVNIKGAVMFFIRFISLLAIYLLIFNIIEKEKDALKIVRAIVYSSIIPISYGFYQYFMETGLFSFDSYKYRLYSTFIHPNVYAFYLLIIFFSIILLYYLEKNVLGKSDLQFKAVMQSLVLIQLIFTYTRGAWIGIIVGLLIVATLIKEIRKFVGICLIIFIPIFLPQILDRIADLIERPRRSFYMSSWAFRLEHWYALLKNAFIHKPLLGYGLGQSMFVAVKYSRFTNIPHNDYLRILIEGGIIGLLPFIIFWAHNIMRLFRKIQKKVNLEFNSILLSLIASLLVSSAADNLIYSISISGYLFALMAVCHKLDSLRLQEL